MSDWSTDPDSAMYQCQAAIRDYLEKKKQKEEEDAKKRMSESDVEFFKPGDGDFDGSQMISINDANRLLKERGTVVWQPRTDKTKFGAHSLLSQWVEMDEWPGATHQALLINIRPIPIPDTAESLLREFVDWIGPAEIPNCDLKKRVKKLLDKK